MIICLEGASAVGKTTTCSLLAQHFDAFVVPEVNALFTRPGNARCVWYLERQVDRWAMASREAARGRLAVLDGDPFQPLWYNWAFRYEGFQSLKELGAFYRPLIAQGLLNFPDIYVHLVAEENELRRRKNEDTSRSRRNFESHLVLTVAQPRYFDAMASLEPSMVERLTAVSLDENVVAIERVANSSRKPIKDQLALFDGLVEWLEDSDMSVKPMVAA